RDELNKKDAFITWLNTKHGFIVDPIETALRDIHSTAVRDELIAEAAPVLAKTDFGTAYAWAKRLSQPALRKSTSLAVAEFDTVGIQKPAPPSLLRVKAGLIPRVRKFLGISQTEKTQPEKREDDTIQFEVEPGDTRFSIRIGTANQYN